MIGTIEEGALPDILIIDGNPLEDTAVIGANPERITTPDRKKTQQCA